jgi:hypothetical protein
MCCLSFPQSSLQRSELRQAIAELDRQRKDARTNRLMSEKAKLIQTHWRSKAVRISPAIAAFQQRRRDFFALRELENPVRETWSYRIRAVCGAPWALQLRSDTVAERLRTTYGWNSWDMLEDSVQYDMRKAYSLLREQMLWEEDKASGTFPVIRPLSLADKEMRDLEEENEKEEDKQDDDDDDGYAASGLVGGSAMQGLGDYVHLKDSDSPDDKSPAPEEAARSKLLPGEPLPRLGYSVEDLGLKRALRRAKFKLRQTQHAAAMADYVLKDLDRQFAKIERQRLEEMGSKAKAQKTPPQILEAREKLKEARQNAEQAADELRESEAALAGAIGPRGLDHLLERKQVRTRPPRVCFFPFHPGATFSVFHLLCPPICLLFALYYSASTSSSTYSLAHPLHLFSLSSPSSPSSPYSLSSLSLSLTRDRERAMP